MTFSTAILTIAMDLAETSLYAAGEDGIVYKVNLLASRDAFASATGGAISTFSAHESAVTALACSFDGTLLLSTSSDSTAKVWDTRSRQNVSSFIQHKGSITAAMIMPLPTVRLPGSGCWQATHPGVLQRHPYQPEEGEAWTIEAVPLTTMPDESTSTAMEVDGGDPLSGELQRISGTAASLQEENRQWKTLCNELHQQAMESCVQSLSSAAPRQG